MLFYPESWGPVPLLVAVLAVVALAGAVVARWQWRRRRSAREE